MSARFLPHWWGALLWPLSVLSSRVPVESKGEAAKDQLVPETVQRLRQVLGLGETPRASGPLRRAPRYMLDLFNAVADANGVSKSPGLLQGNVVRSYEDKVHGNQTWFYFNVTSVGRNEQLLKAELRLFKLREHSQPASQLCRVDLCELLDSSGTRVEVISSRIIPLSAEGWQVFPVTQTVWQWVRNSSSNHGFMISAGIPSQPSAARFAKNGDANTDSRPFLVIFSEDHELEALRPLDPTGHRPSRMKKESVVSAMPSPLAQLPQSRKIRAVPLPTMLPCQRHPLYVDFEQIGWSGWIISPRGYSAYYCQGACPFPLGQGFKITNHATVQSIVHALKLSTELGSPCCVPDNLHSINLLYFDNEENVVLRQYRDMVAVSCGCH
ncbi:bone morphogenetic protein 7-like [Chiloscyllium punctatum]|uniref:bone morphogenetic protein 7-like n=1 Tax=Chiloscyllium punctatum TaxID=137246 RepID=UPI003B632D8E